MSENRSENRKKDDALTGHDTRKEIPARRCQTHNALMEELGKLGQEAYYFCPAGCDVQRAPR